MDEGLPAAGATAGLNLVIDTSKVDAALAQQPRITVSSVANGQQTTLLEISKLQRPGEELADNQVNVLC
jgi:hypothetical protein